MHDSQNNEQQAKTSHHVILTWPRTTIRTFSAAAHFLTSLPENTPGTEDRPICHNTVYN